MNPTTPATLNFLAYRGDTFAFAFQFKGTSGDPFDMSYLGAVTMHVFRARKEETPLFSVTLTESASTITGELSAEQTIQLRPIVAYYEMRSTFQGRDITLVNGSIVTLDATQGQGVTDYISELKLDLANLSVELTLGDSATIALQAKADAELARDGAVDAETNAITQVGLATTQAGIATTQAGISTTQAGIATTQAGIATTQVGLATTQADRSRDEADRAETVALTVENAVDAFDQSSNALLATSLLTEVAQKVGQNVLVPSGEPANGTVPTGYGALFVDGNQIKVKFSNNTVVTL